VNLADAIRHAASGGTFAAPAPARTPAPVSAPAPVFTANSKKSKKKEFVDAVRKGGSSTGDGLVLEDNFEDLTVTAPQNAATAFPVKFELYLSPEQLTGLFKGVVTTQHSVMTLRETARYLRIPGRKLEELAHLGQIPAFLIDGKWRFARNSVDEWLAQRPFRKEMEA
jgi:excisionase family DNA binding protein